MEDATVIVQAGELIPVENALSHSVGFLYQAMYSPGGASIMGTGLWQLKVFANRRADGSHHRKAYETLVALTADQTNAPLSEINRVPSFPGRTVALNLQNTECRQTPYFCVQLLKGVNPSPEFSLHGAPDDSALITCDSLDCNGKETKSKMRWVFRVFAVVAFCIRRESEMINIYISGNECQGCRISQRNHCKLASPRKPVNKGACYVNQKHRG